MPDLRRRDGAAHLRRPALNASPHRRRRATMAVDRPAAPRVRHRGRGLRRAPPRLPRRAVRRLVALAGPDARVLDAGAGTGKVAAALASGGLTGTAVEPDPDMAAVARRQSATPGWDVVVGELETCDVARRRLRPVHLRAGMALDRHRRRPRPRPAPAPPRRAWRPSSGTAPTSARSPAAAGGDGRRLRPPRPRHAVVAGVERRPVQRVMPPSVDPAPDGFTDADGADVPAGRALHVGHLDRPARHALQPRDARARPAGPSCTGRSATSSTRTGARSTSSTAVMPGWPGGPEDQLIALMAMPISSFIDVGTS